MIAAITSYRARNKAEDIVTRKLRRALFSHQFLNFDVWIELHFHRLFWEKRWTIFHQQEKSFSVCFFVVVVFVVFVFHLFSCFKMWLSFSHILPQPQRLLVRVCDYVVKWKCMRCSILIFSFFLFCFYPCWQSDVVAPNLIPNFHYRSFHFLLFSTPSLFSPRLNHSQPTNTIPFLSNENV